MFYTVEGGDLNDYYVFSFMNGIRHEREAGMNENLVYPTTAVSTLLPIVR